MQNKLHHAKRLISLQPTVGPLDYIPEGRMLIRTELFVSEINILGGEVPSCRIRTLQFLFYIITNMLHPSPHSSTLLFLP